MINDSDEPIIVNSDDDENQKKNEDIAKAIGSSKSRTTYSYYGNGNNTPTFLGSRTTHIYDGDGRLISIVEGS